MTGPSGLSDGVPETNAKLKSQISARRARERELERKRARGEISCAECRRLKLKCNKKVPCASCIRRGCHTICPNGLLATGQGSRFVLANTDKLHGKLLQMSQRIRQLEDALQILQSSVSKAPHPLLSEQLLSIKLGVDGETDNLHEKDTDELIDEEDEIAAALGTLSVSESGETRFIGRVAAETLLMNEPPEPLDETNEYYHEYGCADADIEANLPEDLINASKDFPFSHTHLPKGQLISLIAEHLPTYERATALAEAYLGNVAWLPRPIDRSQIMEDLIPLVYKGKRAELPTAEKDETGTYNGVHRMHTLALLLAVFACGAAGDFTLPPNNAEGRLFHVLSLAALSAHPILGTGGASLETVQSVITIAIYDFVSGCKPTLESAWKTVSLGLIIAASIGLHRDPAVWNMESRYIQRRRFVFWEIFSLDKYKSMGTGRPSTFHLQEVDCEFPEDIEGYVNDDGKRIEGTDRWRHRFVKEIIGPIAELLCMTRPLKYSEILDFDRRIREFPDPMISPSTSGSDLVDDVKNRSWTMQKDIAFLSIHRNFFARAMIKHPSNPLRSPFSPSFLAAYASSIRFLRTARSIFDHIPGMILRLWPVWIHSLTSGVIIGSVAANISQASLANAAFNDLNLAVALFEVASKHPVVRRGLPILLRLRERARVALQNMASEAGLPAGVTVPKVEKDEADELNILRGGARLVHNPDNKKRSNRTSSQLSSGDSHGTSKSDGGSNSSSSPSPMLAMMPTSTSASTGQAAADGMLFASPSFSVQSDPNTSMVFSSPTPSSLQSTSTPIDQDIASLFNMIYNSPNDGSDPGSIAALLNLNPEAYAQSQGSGQQPSQFFYGPENPQVPGPFNSGPFSMQPNDPWLSEAARIESMIPGAFSVSPQSFVSAPNVNVTAPSYDLSWLTANDPGAPADTGGDSAQFLEDWRSQAAVEGSHYLTEPEMDVRMSF